MAESLGEAILHLSTDSSKLEAGLAGAKEKTGGFFSSLGGMATMFGGVALFAGLTEGISHAIDKAEEASKTTAQLNTVLASTKGVSGMTAESVEELAAGLSKQTLFSKDAVISADNMLLTFTNLGKDVMPQATETVLNMSQALGQDTKSSAIQLGKALNDPIAGITALSRVGVTFSAQQKEQIKGMVDSGHAAQAQGVILKELNTEFGNSAKAAGQTLPGQIDILKRSFDGIYTQVGTALMPILVDLGGTMVGWTQGAISIITDTIIPLFGKVADAVRPFIGALKDIAQGVADVFGNGAEDMLQIGFEKIFGVDSPLVGGAMAAVTGLTELAQTVFYIGKVVAGAVSDFMQFHDAGMALDDLQEVFDVLQTYGSAAVADLIEAFGRIVPWLAQEEATLITTLVSWGEAFVAWVAPMIPPLLQELETLAGQALAWIGAEVGPLIDQLGQWGLQFVAWVAPMIQPMLAQAEVLAGQLLDWIAAEAPPLLEKFVGEWVPAAIGWVAKAAMALLPELPGILWTVGSWIANEGVPKLVTLAVDLGGALIRGLIQGVGQGMGALAGAIGDMAGNAIAAAKEALGIHSPSKVFHVIGQQITQGMAEGILSGTAMVGDALVVVSRALLDVPGLRQALGGIAAGSPQTATPYTADMTRNVQQVGYGIDLNNAATKRQVQGLLTSGTTADTAFLKAAVAYWQPLLEAAEKETKRLLDEFNQKQKAMAANDLKANLSQMADIIKSSNTDTNIWNTNAANQYSNAAAAYNALLGSLTGKGLAAYTAAHPGGFQAPAAPAGLASLNAGSDAAMRGTGAGAAPNVVQVVLSVDGRQMGAATTGGHIRDGVTLARTGAVG